jgi:sugar lactone lactonase YvrE
VRPVPKLASALLAALLLAAACSGDDDPVSSPSDDDAGDEAGDEAAGGATDAGAPIIFSTEGNNLNAYVGADPFEKQTVIPTVADDPDGMDINGQLCFFPDDPHRLIAGEDTGQPERTPGWGIFEVEGERVGDLSATEVGRLVPSYQNDPDNYGCGVLSDGRVVTTDLGNKVEGPPSGQLIIWFPPFDSEQVSYCKIDVALPTPGGIVVGHDDSLYVATARPPGNGILRFTGPYPTSADAAGGCGRADPLGAPLADAVDKQLFIPADEHTLTPNALAVDGDGNFYVSSAFTGTIARYGPDGAFLDTIVTPAPGDDLGAEPRAGGAPFGLQVLDDGTIYWADLGLVANADGVGPLDGTGTVRRYDPGTGQASTVIDEGLDFPDGIGVFRP